MTVEEARAMLLASGASAATLKAALAGLFTKDKGKTKRLISTQLQAWAAGPGVHRVKDAVGLYLRKGEGDAGNWFHRYWFGGKRREIGLGALTATTLTEVRKKLAEIVALRSAGKDPIVVRRAAKRAAADTARAEEIAANKWTFKVAVEDYLAAHIKSWKRADAKRTWHGPFVRYAYPVLGPMLLDDIKVDNIVAVMNACTEASVKATGIKLRGHIEQVLNSAIAKGQRNASLGNPASVRLVKATSPAMRRLNDGPKHHRRIAIDDAPAIFRHIAELAMGKSTHAAWAFAILTASRPGEALYAKWDEIDLVKKIWICPGGPDGRMKPARTMSCRCRRPRSPSLTARPRSASATMCFPAAAPVSRPTSTSPPRRSTQGSTPARRIPGARSFATGLRTSAASGVKPPRRRSPIRSAPSRPPIAVRPPSRRGAA